jgi:broad specificity phosphatase PhoE
MPVIEKLAKIAKGIFSNTDGSAKILPLGRASNTNAGPDYDLTGYLSAMPPLPAMGPADYEIRKRDFRIAENIDYIPGGGKFLILKAIADKWNVLRIIIDTKKDLVATVPWSIKLEPDENMTDEEVKEAAANDPVIEQLTNFWRCPDGISTWFEWIKEALENTYVLDALSIEVVREGNEDGTPNPNGKICGLVVVSGDTINRVIDDRGWTPAAPQVDPRDGVKKYPVAYQQVIGGGGSGSEGVPQRNMTVKDLVYAMRNPRPGYKWGQSSVEKIVTYAMTGIYADEFIKDYYTSGNQPPGIMVLSGMPPEKIEEYEKKWNAVYAGNLATRRRVAMISAGPGDNKSVQFIPTKEPLLKTDIYLDFIRFACAEFSIPSVPFERPMNRASAQASGEQATEAGLVPDLTWLAGIINKIIKSPLYFNLPNYTFAFGERRSVNAKDAADVDKTYVGGAMETINEARKKIGLPPSDEPNADKLGAMSPQNGWIPLNSDDFIDLQQKTADAQPKPANTTTPPKPPAAPSKKAAPAPKGKKKKMAGDPPILLARHGATKLDTGGDSETVAGQSPVPLDADGIAEAGRLADSLKDEGLTCILSSTTKRARQTADIVSGLLDIPVILDSDLDAPDYPALVGQTVGDSKAAWADFKKNPDVPMGEGGETYGNFMVRNQRALSRARQMADEGSKPLMMSHSRNIESLTGKEEAPTGVVGVH